jgi:hypothetical protein
MESESEPGRYHVWGWLLYHWHWNTRSKALGAYQDRLSAGDDPADAWRASLPDLDPESPDAMAELERQLDGYRRSGRYAHYALSAAADAAFVEVQLPPACVHMMLLDVRRGRPDGKEVEALGRAEAEEALKEDPSQPRALQLRARLEKAPAAPALRKSVEARPGDWQAWFLLAASLEDDADMSEREAALRKAVARDGLFPGRPLATMVELHLPRSRSRLLGASPEPAPSRIQASA